MADLSSLKKMLNRKRLGLVCQMSLKNGDKLRKELNCSFKPGFFLPDFAELANILLNKDMIFQGMIGNKVTKNTK